MPVKKLKRKELPADLQGKKIKEAKYRRKHGKVAVLPVLIFSLLFSGLAAASGLAHCSSPALTFTDSNIVGIWVNGTDGANTDMWILNSSGSGGTFYHYDALGTTSKGAPWNCSYSDAGSDYAVGFFGNGTDMWIVRTSNMITYGTTCTQKAYSDYSSAGTAMGVTTGNTTSITSVWITNATGFLQEFQPNMASTATQLSNCTVTGITSCSGLGSSPTGDLLYVDNTDADGCVYVVNRTCGIQDTWNLTNIVAGGKIGDLETTDGQLFWSNKLTSPFNTYRWANDSTPPTLRNQGSNKTYMGRNDTMQLWAENYDACNLTYVWVKSNESGGMLHITGDTSNTSVGVSDTWTNSTFNWKNTTYYGRSVGYALCAIDSAGNSNCSTASAFNKLPTCVSHGGATLGIAACTNEYDCTWAVTAAGIVNHSFYFEMVYRNATHSECNYAGEKGARTEITNETIDGVNRCVINQSAGDSITTADTFRVHEFIAAKGAAPSNLPAALAGLVATLMILVYSYTTKRT